jgi:hypothetical protein
MLSQISAAGVAAEQFTQLPDTQVSIPLQVPNPFCT